MKTRIIMLVRLLILLACGLPAFAQTTPCPSGVAHCVILTWQNPNSNPVVFHVYKAPGACPAAGTDLTMVIPPFAVEANTIGASSLTMTTYVDTSISFGTYSYYVTADIGTDATAAGNGVGPMQSAPSNCAQAVIPASFFAVTPPTGAAVVVQ